MFLRAKSAAAMIDIPVSTFYALVRRGELPPACGRVGKHMIWRKATLVAVVDPAGYNDRNGQDQAPPRHPPSGTPQRPRKVLLGPGTGDRGRAANARSAAGRSAFAGILGRPREGEEGFYLPNLVHD